MADDPRALLLKSVKEAIEAGLCVLPPSNTGTKRPLPGGSPQWDEYKKQKSTPEEIRKWYSDKTITGIGLVCGAVSGGIECLDFDERAISDEYNKATISAGLSGLLERLKLGYYEHSPNGAHLLYRCQEINGNTKLATRPKTPEEMKDANDKTKTLIETRGEGGFIIIAPTYGTVNPAGNYQLISGSLATIPTITPDERKALHELARTFNILDEKQLEFEQRQASRDTKSEGRPGDDFNRRVPWDDILLQHGWTRVFTRGDTTYWRRPGKTFGISATTNHQGSDLLYVFSSSTPFEPNRGYTKFSAYTTLNHAGDFSASARELSRENYGDMVHYDQLGVPNENDYSAMAGTDRKPLFISAPDILSQSVEYKPLIGKVIERDSTGQVFGPSGGGKTFFVLDLSCCLATGSEWNGHRCEKGIVLYFAGEGHTGLKRRVKAWDKHNDYPDLSNLYISRTAISFDALGIRQVLSEVGGLETITGSQVALIVIDTLARHIQGDENSTQNMSEFVRAVDSLRCSFPGSTAIIVHHTGNNTEQSDRSRGSSALKAACDFEIKCDKGLLTYTKVKDGEQPDPLEFKLVPVEIGLDEDGEPITSCIVQYGERSAKNREVFLTRNEQRLLDIVKAEPGILVGDLRSKYYDHRRKLDPDVKTNTMKNAFLRAYEGLVGKQVIHEIDYAVLLVEPKPSHVTLPSQTSFCDGGETVTNVTHPYIGCDDVTPPVTPPPFSENLTFDISDFEGVEL